VQVKYDDIRETGLRDMLTPCESNQR